MSTTDQTPEFQPVWAHDLANAGGGDIPWLWHGFLAPGKTTLLTSQWKSGKTTLAAILLARLKEGGQVAGLDLRPGKAVIISEESSQDWYQRSRKLAFGDHLCWFIRPFRGRPSFRDWQALQDTILDLHAAHHFDLAVIDPLLQFLPAASENSATGMIDFLSTLNRFKEAGMALWLPHHPRKGRVLPGQAARGSGALSGFVDIIMEKDFYKAADSTDRRRCITAYSRSDQTPRRLVIELNAEGTDYLNRGEFEPDDFMENWKHVRGVLQESRTKLTRKEILDNWPPDYPAPSSITLYRWLEHALKLRLVNHDGLGTKAYPFHYWLVERENDAWFVYIKQMERFYQELHQIVLDMGYFDTNEMPADAKEKAEQVARQRVYGDAPPKVPWAEDDAPQTPAPFAAEASEDSPPPPASAASAESSAPGNSAGPAEPTVPAESSAPAACDMETPAGSEPVASPDLPPTAESPGSRQDPDTTAPPPPAPAPPPWTGGMGIWVPR
jgi:hypothetical protein